MRKIFKETNFKQASVFKNIALFGLVGAISFSTSSCSDFLEKEPTFISKENYYSNAAEMDIALTGIYSTLGNEYIYGSQLPYHLSMSDEGVWQRNSLVGTEVYVYDASHDYVRMLWRYLYEGIERANVFLEKLEASNMTQAEKDVAKGEAKFLRAYYHFILASNYGEVPLKDKSTYSVNDVNHPNTPLPTLYNFITKEMEEAEALVKPITPGGHAGRITKSAVRGVLARVYLKMAGAPLNGGKPYFEKAAEWADKLVNAKNGDYQHSLVSDYTQLFKDMAADKYNVEESIWEVEFHGNRGVSDFEQGRHGNIGGIAMSNELYGKKGKAGYSYGFILGSKKLLDTYGTGTDVRRDWNIAPYKISMSNNNSANATYSETDARSNPYNRYAAKLRRDYEVVFDRHKNYTPINFPLLRYSDVLLMYAEAKNELGEVGEAAIKVQMVRARANGADSTAIIGNDQAKMRRFIKNERFRELAYEGIRKFDLIRWGDFVGAMSGLAADIKAHAPSGQQYTAFGPGNVTARNVLLPIPLDEMSLNKAITQNPGW